MLVEHRNVAQFFGYLVERKNCGSSMDRYVFLVVDFHGLDRHGNYLS
jgi:hypothetical protein